MIFNGELHLSKMHALGNWLPGSLTPSYLDSLPASYGFDPLGLGSTPSNLARYQEAELIHCRWAMLGVTGALVVEFLGFGNWYDAPLATKQTYFGIDVPFPLSTLIGIEILLMAAVEGRRFDTSEQAKRLYPGFDFAGFSKDPKTFDDMKIKEIKNGRLAMLAFVGLIAQHAATGKTPLTNLADHIFDPFHVNVSSNGVSLPFL
jgi:light-harvesting complex I chlorophyll a/b binding protein 1